VCDSHQQKEFIAILLKLSKLTGRATIQAFPKFLSAHIHHHFKRKCNKLLIFWARQGMKTYDDIYIITASQIFFGHH
jgi:hypothetical protein